MGKMGISNRIKIVLNLLVMTYNLSQNKDTSYVNN